MGKLMELVWLSDSGERVYEKVVVVNDDDPDYVPGLINLNRDKSRPKTVDAMSPDIIVFEDGYGLFLIPKEKVIKIKKVY